MMEALSKSSLEIAVDINSVCEQCSEMTQSQGHVRGSPESLGSRTKGLVSNPPVVVRSPDAALCPRPGAPFWEQP